jgi:hypothetical protein
VLTAADQFGHRETDGIVVDLFWNRRNLKDEFSPCQWVENEAGSRAPVLDLDADPGLLPPVRGYKSRPSTWNASLRDVNFSLIGAR